MTGTLMLTYGCLFGDIPDQDYHRHLADFAQRRQQDAERGPKTGKEPFDFAKFAALYAHDTGSCERLRPDAPEAVRNYYKHMYYSDFPTAHTIREFARQLNEIDAQG